MRTTHQSAKTTKKSLFSQVAYRHSMELENLENRQLMSATGITTDIASTNAGPVLEVHGTMYNDVISVSQSNNSLTVYDDGMAVGTYTGNFAEIDVYAAKGSDYVYIDPSVTVNTCLRGGLGDDTLIGGSGRNTIFGGRGENLLNAGAGTSVLFAGSDDGDTLVGIGGNGDTLVGGAGNDTFWTAADSGAVIQGFHDGDADQDVAGFQSYQTTDDYGDIVTVAPGMQTVLGDSFAEPGVNVQSTGAATQWTNVAWHKLFASGGPIAADIQQGALGDCYFLSTMAGISQIDPAVLRQNITALGDGTFAVMFMQNNTPTYYRVDGYVPADDTGSPAFERMPADGSVWSLIYEKAWTEARATTDALADYGNIEGGDPAETFAAFGAQNIEDHSASEFSSVTDLLNWVDNETAQGRAAEFCTVGDTAAVQGAGLVEGHAYTVEGVVTDTEGNVYLELRNPWGTNPDATTGGANDGVVYIPASSLAGTFSSVQAATI